MKKDTEKCCGFHKISWNINNVEFFSNISLADEVEVYESDTGSHSDLELKKGRQIIYAEPSAIVYTTKIHPVNLMSQRKVGASFIHRYG